MNYRRGETFMGGFVLLAIVVFLVGLGFLIGITAAFVLHVIA